MVSLTRIQEHVAGKVKLIAQEKLSNPDPGQTP
jgi:hypothetical protein